VCLLLIIGAIFFSLTFFAFSVTFCWAAFLGLEAELWLAGPYLQMAKNPSEKQESSPPLNNLRLKCLNSG
jgi:polyferredoxin